MPVQIRKEALQKALAKKQISQNAFALYVGTSKGYMSQLINSRRNPSNRTVKKILNHFKNEYTFDDLFFWIPRKKKSRYKKTVK